MNDENILYVGSDPDKLYSWGLKSRCRMTKYQVDLSAAQHVEFTGVGFGQHDVGF